MHSSEFCESELQETQGWSKTNTRRNTKSKGEIHPNSEKRVSWIRIEISGSQNSKYSTQICLEATLVRKYEPANHSLPGFENIWKSKPRVGVVHKHPILSVEDLLDQQLKKNIICFVFIFVLKNKKKVYLFCNLVLNVSVSCSLFL